MAETITPRNKQNPSQTGRIARSAGRDIRKAMRQIQTAVLVKFKAIPFQKINTKTGEVINNSQKINTRTGKAFRTNEVRYEYLVDQLTIADLSLAIQQIIERFLLENRTPDWFMNQAIDLGYQQGTAESIINLTTIAPDTYTRTLETVLFSAPYQQRLAFVLGRNADQFDAFSRGMETDLKRVLGDGMAAGDSPRVVARKVRKQIGGSQKEALRISRTEINMAHRRARWDEAQSAQEDLGIQTKMMHFSALSITTRFTHAFRHGKLYTVKQTADWYSVDANAINCKCSQAEVLVDSKGEPEDDSLSKKTQSEGKEFFSKQKSKKGKK